ncbi:glycosyltransferase family 4 protein [Aestuariibacter halophilus]|uniref:Glycosyltransferase family 4 protein n=1 Tax=Fluctibacter halophilus TaxID=226011 RepID=A0ABS8G2M9_9ALTE|nr:glycosyltransferase family 4 protein [Aestuariibacter halophilus]MCC2614825.1 glycosyltransferase family 4 protein [Aestuariibacter halophilus]
MAWLFEWLSDLLLAVHILFLTDNFPPEGNAPASRTFEHCKVWVAQGHEVTVITCAPNFPDGKVYPGYKNNWYKRSVVEGINVVRVKTYMAENKGFLRRILDFMSFMVSGFFAAVWARKVDVVVGTSPQFFTAIAAWAAAKLKRRPFVFEVRDIWPASLVAVGAAKEGSAVIKMFEKIEMFLYGRATLIVAVTNQFKRELVNRGVNGAKIGVVTNGVDLTLYKQREKSQELLASLGLQNKFVVGYIGTHGMAHGLDKVIESAELLEGDSDIHFLLVGGGARVEVLKNSVVEKGLTNVSILGRQPKETMPDYWSLCDVALISLKDSPLFESVIPSKTFECFAMGLPTIVSVPSGEITGIVEEYEAGIIVKPENPNDLSRAILKLRDDAQALETYRSNALKAAKHFDRSALALKMLAQLEQTL